MPNKPRYNWYLTAFFVGTPILALLGTAWLMWHDAIPAQTWWLALIMATLTGMSITAGYHRLYSHTTYKTCWPVDVFFAIFGACSFQGSILEWSTDHRTHHRYVDTPKDPYNIKQGFWHAHMDWILKLDYSKRDFSNVEDLTRNPVVRFQHRFFLPIAILSSFGLPTLIACLWNDPLGGFMIAGLLRMVVNHHFTFCINSVCHVFGKRTYTLEQTARDNWFTALFTWGEGFHNFHHQFALDYRNGIRWFHFDPGKWLIWTLRTLGLARDLKKIDDETILKYKLKAEAARLANQPEEKISQIKQAQQAMLTKLAALKELKVNYQELKQKEYLNRVQRGAESGKAAIKELKRRIKDGQKELDMLYQEWLLSLKAIA